MITNKKDLEDIKNKILQHEEGKIIIRVALSTCSITAGAEKIYEIAKKYECEEIKVIKTGCLGLCYAEPTMEIEISNKEKIILGNLTTEETSNIMEKLKNKNYPLNRISLRPKEYKIVLKNCGKINPEDINSYISRDGYFALYKALKELKSNKIIEEIKESRLRGRGGAGYPTGIKWELLKNEKSMIKYIVCNADEGDPGAYMDRAILEGDPHRIIEGMIIAGYATGSNQGYIYIRAESPYAIERLKIAIGQAYEAGLLGKNIFKSSFSFNLELKYGAGAFVCGEETALIKSMEGKRGEPCVKPPYPVEKGYYNFPTIVNNVETFANISPIILNGNKWFRNIGTTNSPGTKVFALVGKIKNTGLVEVPLGTTLREIIDEIGGGIKNNKKFKAVQTGGPSGGCLSSDELDIKLEYDTLIQHGTMMGSGGMIIMDEDDCMVGIAKFYIGFSVFESCGKCSTCRIGTKRIYEILDRITKKEGKIDDLNLLKEISIIVKRASLCGLGKSAPNPVLSTLNKFKIEYEEHIKEKKCRAEKCFSSLKYFINSKCIGCNACMKNCPVKAIIKNEKKQCEIQQEKCIKCGNCIRICKFSAVQIERG